jgi:hypothetical protein
MSTHFSAMRSRLVLGPDDLRLAADVFEQALHQVDESASDIAPHATRQLLARHIIEEVLGGERDPDRLREGALASLSSAAEGAPGGTPQRLPPAGSKPP